MILPTIVFIPVDNCFESNRLCMCFNRRVTYTVCTDPAWRLHLGWEKHCSLWTFGSNVCIINYFSLQCNCEAPLLIVDVLFSTFSFTLIAGKCTLLVNLPNQMCHCLGFKPFICSDDIFICCMWNLMSSQLSRTSWLFFWSHLICWESSSKKNKKNADWKHLSWWCTSAARQQAARHPDPSPLHQAGQ